MELEPESQMTGAESTLFSEIHVRGPSNFAAERVGFDDLIAALTQMCHYPGRRSN